MYWYEVIRVVHVQAILLAKASHWLFIMQTHLYAGPCGI